MRYATAISIRLSARPSHSRTLSTGQLLLALPDIERFKRQAEKPFDVGNFKHDTRSTREQTLTTSAGRQERR